MSFKTQKVGPGEYALIAILTRIVMETMDYPPVRPYDSESHLPANLIEDAQSVLNEYGARVAANPEFVSMPQGEHQLTMEPFTEQDVSAFFERYSDGFAQCVRDALVQRNGLNQEIKQGPRIGQRLTGDDLSCPGIQHSSDELTLDGGPSLNLQGGELKNLAHVAPQSGESAIVAQGGAA